MPNLDQKRSGLCGTGGEALQVSTTAAQKAAEEARSGKWLQELEGGGPLRALPPGMERGAFGAWALHDGEGQGHSPTTCVWGCKQLLGGVHSECCAILSADWLQWPSCQ